MALFNWREHLPVHPAAELFPLMSEAELKELADDIRKNGMVEPIVFWVKGDVRCLLDGRNRLDAMALAGLLGATKEGSLYNVKTGRPIKGYGYDDSRYRDYDYDPYALVLSLNVHRRHLSNDQKRKLIANVLKAQPEASDRQIAKSTKADHKTVATVRREEEGRGEIPHVAQRTDAKGRKQPAKKSKKATITKPALVSTALSRADPIAAATEAAKRTADRYVGRNGEPVTESAEASAEKRKAKYADDNRMPTEEEAEEDYQKTVYDQACLILEEMSDETRRKYFAYIEGKYSFTRERDNSVDLSIPADLSIPPLREQMAAAADEIE
jgi:hypothetical protein